jgi:hypothetical protein
MHRHNTPVHIFGSRKDTLIFFEGSEYHVTCNDFLLFYLRLLVHLPRNRNSECKQLQPHERSYQWRSWKNKPMVHGFNPTILMESLLLINSNFSVVSNKSLGSAEPIHYIQLRHWFLPASYIFPLSRNRKTGTMLHMLHMLPCGFGPASLMITYCRFWPVDDLGHTVQ